jgi:hypothetical protein
VGHRRLTDAEVEAYAEMARAARKLQQAQREAETARQGGVPPQAQRGAALSLETGRPPLRIADPDAGEEASCEQ